MFGAVYYSPLNDKLLVMFPIGCFYHLEYNCGFDFFERIIPLISGPMGKNACAVFLDKNQYELIGYL